MADFESIVDKKKTRVWLWGKCNIETELFEYGIDIDSFMSSVSKIDSVVYFHNLKFDGNFIIYWLLNNGFKHVTCRDLVTNQFNTLISDLGQFYTIKVKFNNGVKCEFRDSLKILTMSVEAMPKAFGLNLSKKEIDYKADRPIGYQPTEKEIEYVKNDVMIVAKSLRFMFDKGLTKLTAGSNALADYKSMMEKNSFLKKFPFLGLDVDKDIRLSYKGGWTYVNPKYKDQRLGKGQVYDVNSMYPWAMKYCMLPYGQPIFYQGEYKEDKLFPLYIQCFKCRFKLKEGHYPSIQLKGNHVFAETEYIVDSQTVELLYLTNVDLDLMRYNYDMFDIEWICGYKFKGTIGLFDAYIDKWYEVKKQSKEEGNKAMSTLAKLFLNSLYGKFGTNPLKRSKYPYLSEGIVKYQTGGVEETKGGYIPIASYITSYARDRIIRAAVACGDRFAYADTDSIHIIGSETPDIDIDEYRLGAFKLESTFTEAFFHRAKCYIEADGDKLDKKCAGLPKEARDQFTFDTIHPGAVFHGKLVPVNVEGGTVLVERDFTIK